MEASGSTGQQYVQIALIIAVWILTLWLAGVMARWKGRSPGGWRIAALFAGPLVLLVLLVIPSSTYTEPSSAVAAKPSPMPMPMRTCPHCISEIPARASVCRYCQRESAPTEAAAATDQ